MDRKPKPPFRVDIVDQFEGHCEDGYGEWATCDRIEDAIAKARRLTEEGIKECGGFGKWYGMGDAGLVYDSTGKLVWDGIAKAKSKHRPYVATIEDAIKIAVSAHHQQKDKNGEPYILHPLRVMMKMQTEEEMMVAVMHDTLEDSDETVQTLRRSGFKEEIIRAIDCLTKKDNEKYKDYLARVKYHETTLKVKIADIKDNLSPERINGLEANEKERLKKKYSYALDFLESHPMTYGEVLRASLSDPSIPMEPEDFLLQALKEEEEKRKKEEALKKIEEWRKIKPIPPGRVIKKQAPLIYPTPKSTPMILRFFGKLINRSYQYPPFV
ncbi:hypothetical protein ACFLS1_01425 [Verrucomicrobiota bacterium]